MSELPRIATARLALRAPAATDRPAAAWIAACPASHEQGEALALAIERISDGALLGAIWLEVAPQRPCAKLGYWIDTPYRRRGYATEAASAVVAFGFETLGLERIWAPCLRGDAAAARLLEKVGFAHEGSRRQYAVERARAETIEQHGCLRWEYFARVARCGFASAASAPPADA